MRELDPLHSSTDREKSDRTGLRPYAGLVQCARLNVTAIDPTVARPRDHKTCRSGSLLAIAPWGNVSGQVTRRK